MNETIYVDASKEGCVILVDGKFYKVEGSIEKCCSFDGILDKCCKVNDNGSVEQTKYIIIDDSTIGKVFSDKLKSMRIVVLTIDKNQVSDKTKQIISNM